MLPEENDRVVASFQRSTHQLQKHSFFILLLMLIERIYIFILIKIKNTIKIYRV